MQVPDLDEPALRARLRQHFADRHFQEGTLAVYRSLFEQANLVRASVSETRDALKWIAALSTGAFFFVGQSLPKSTAISIATSSWSLGAEAAFVLSILGAAGWLLGVDQRASRWLRQIYRYTSLVTSTLYSMDANANAIRDALDANDLAAANAAFKDTVRDKERLGDLMTKDQPEVTPKIGRFGIAYAYLCVGGLVTGILCVAAEQVSRLTP
jgi:hypothetical protein